MNIYFDGSSSPQLKNGCAWAVVVDGAPLPSAIIQGRLNDDSTSNEAELAGMYHAMLEAVKVNGPVVILGDSKLAINCYTGEFNTKIDRLLVWLEKMWQLEYTGEVKWIPRELNIADEYAKAAKSAVSHR